MINIAIVDDDPSYSELLHSYLRQYSDESGVELHIETFCDGDEIIEGYRAQFDIILMDIEMRFIDGMTAAEEIRRRDPEVVIIFITNMSQYAIRGYAVDALDYVLKPVSYFAFSQRINRAITRMNSEGRKFIIISGKDGALKLEIGNIMYIESQGHNLIFHMSDGQQRISVGTMTEAEEKFSPLNFFRGNKGYIINLAYVEGVVEGCAVVKGESLLLSRSRKKDFMSALTDFVGEEIR